MSSKLQELYRERASLITKKFEEGLTEEEVGRLQFLNDKTDRLDFEAMEPALKKLEGIVGLSEDIGVAVQALLQVVTRPPLQDPTRITENWMQTHTGLRFHPFDPQPDQICVEDIAHALAMNCRFNGHVRRFYSVAEHSVYVSQMVPEEDALWGLLHDAAEAYISDLPKPFKDGIVDIYGPHEERILEVIATKYDLELPYSPEVKKADWGILILERVQALADQSIPWESVEAYDSLYGLDMLPEITIGFWSPEEARERFLERFYELV